MSLGYSMYHVAKLLHYSIFVNGTLTNMETWANFGFPQIEAFEKNPATVFKKITESA